MCKNKVKGVLVAVFLIAKDWMPLKCPSIEDLFNWYVHSDEYCVALNYKESQESRQWRRYMLCLPPLMTKSELQRNYGTTTENRLKSAEQKSIQK